jgi:hypothetical protein
MNAAGFLAIVGFVALTFGGGETVGGWVAGRRTGGPVVIAAGAALLAVALLFAFIGTYITTA